jgi:hypothetical protein
VYPQVNVTALELGRDNQWLSYSFPLVHCSNKQAEQKINYYLQNKTLDNETILTDTNTVFRRSRYISQDSVYQSGYSEISFTVEVNNSRILSLVFQLESTGAYSTDFPAYYNFNGQTGAALSAKDLFTPAGIVEIKKLLIKERKKRIVQWMKEMDTTYNIKEEYEEINETFRQCNSEADENNFLVKSKSILFCKEYCFPHVSRPYDTDLDVEMTYKMINKYLSNNGKRLLLQTN